MEQCIGIVHKNVQNLIYVVINACNYFLNKFLDKIAVDPVEYVEKNVNISVVILSVIKNVDNNVYHATIHVNIHVNIANAQIYVKKNAIENLAMNHVKSCYNVLEMKESTFV